MKNKKIEEEALKNISIKMTLPRMLQGFLYKKKTNNKIFELRKNELKELQNMRNTIEEKIKIFP